MTLHQAPLADCAPQRWRNGGGRTRELLAWPQPNDWTLRVSVADIDASGPFSAFPGVDRWFAVIEGEGVALALPQGERTLTPADAPLAFDGEAAPGCRLIGGATRDLNLMLRRGSLQASMRRADPGAAVEDRTRWRGLYAAAPAVLECGRAVHAVPAGTLVWTDDRDAPAWVVRTSTQAWLMTLEDR